MQCTEGVELANKNSAIGLVCIINLINKYGKSKDDAMVTFAIEKKIKT